MEGQTISVAQLPAEKNNIINFLKNTDEIHLKTIMYTILIKPITCTYIGLCKQNPNTCKASIGIFGARLSTDILHQKTNVFKESKFFSILY